MTQLSRRLFNISPKPNNLDIPNCKIIVSTIILDVIAKPTRVEAISNTQFQIVSLTCGDSKQQFL